MQYPQDIEKIRDVLPESYERFWDTLMNAIVSLVDLQMDKSVGHKKLRIGVFGPYTEEGKRHLEVIAQTICKNNYIPVTGYGAYLPGKCTDLIASKEYFPPIVDELVTKFKIPEFIKFHYFPKLVGRAVVLLESIRTQGNEAEGCYRFGIPMIGLIIDPQVGKDSRGLCNYVLEVKGLYQECMCPEKELCLYRESKPICPFYDYVNVPWAIKQLFMTKINRLVALSTPSSIETSVTEYVLTKMTKPINLDIDQGKSADG
jgi:hypothetical protein